MATKVSLVLKGIQGTKPMTTTVSNVNPQATDATLRELANKIFTMSTQGKVSVNKVITTDLDEQN